MNINAKGDGNGSTVEERAAAILHKFQLEPTNLPSKITAAFRRFRWALVGIAPRVLTKCSKSEASTYGALAWLMLGTAIVTATGLAVKAQIGLNLGAFSTMAVWLFSLGFSLSLETAVLGAVSGSSNLGSLMLRCAVGALLVTIQITPLLTMALKSRIELDLYNQSQAAQVWMKSTRDTLADVKGLADKTKQLADDELKATAAISSPPPDPKVSAAAKSLAEAGVALTLAQKAEKNSNEKLISLQAALKKADDEVTWNRIQNAILKAEIALKNFRSNVNAADISVKNAQSSLKIAKDEQQTQLESLLTEARNQVIGHSAHLKQVDVTLAKDAEYAKELADKAAAANFVTELVALAKLASKDSSVALICFGALLAALLIDLIPITVKFAMRNRLYAQLIAGQDAELLAKSCAKLKSSNLDIEQELMLKRNQVDGVAKFVQIDQGHISAIKIAQSEQADVDTTDARSASRLLSIQLDDLHHVIERLIEIEHLVAQHPNIEPAYREQLSIILCDLQARAQAMAEQLKNPDLGATLGRSVGSKL